MKAPVEPNRRALEEKWENMGLLFAIGDNTKSRDVRNKLIVKINLAYNQGKLGLYFIRYKLYSNS